MMQVRGKGAGRHLPAILAVCLLAALVAAFGDEALTLASLDKVDGAPLYVMRFYGGYAFDAFLQQGISASPDQPAGHPASSAGWACTVFSALNRDGDPLLGRNFDWHNRAALLLFTHPPDGYRSVSMVDVSYLGFDVPHPSWRHRLELLHAPYWPFDGLNEQGLAVGMMAVPQGQDRAEPGQVTIGGLHAIRLILDHARTVDEAIALFSAYQIDFEGGPPLHYLVADAQGNSAIIELVNGDMVTIPTEEPWQVATNFLVSTADAGASGSPCPRYARASTRLQQSEGELSPGQAMDLLESVSQPNTMWSVVYALTSGDILISMDRDYGNPYSFKLAATTGEARASPSLFFAKLDSSGRSW